MSPSRATETYWRRRVPEHWDIPSNFSLFQERIDRGGDESEMLTVTIDLGILRQSDFLKGSSKKDSSNEDKSKYKRVKIGDLAYNKMRMWQGAVGFSRYEGIVSPTYIVLEPRRQINPRYYHHLFRTPLYTHLSSQHSHGICDDQNSLRFEDFKRIFSPLPPLPEQDAIVAYLDEKLEAIDRYLRVKEREIALLEERKRALIHRAVTRGLDDNPQLQPSGIPWLPEIPVGWDCVKFRRIIRTIEQGWSPVASNDEESHDRWAVVTLSAVKSGKFFDSKHKTLPESLKPASRLEIKQGDFLLTRGNTRELVGDVCIVGAIRPRLILSDLTYRITLEEKPISKEFVMLILLSSFGREQIQNDARGSNETMVKVSQGHIKNWDIVLPPLELQEEIVRVIEAKIRPLSTTITRACQ